MFLADVPPSPDGLPTMLIRSVDIPPPYPLIGPQGAPPKGIEEEADEERDTRARAIKNPMP